MQGTPKTQRVVAGLVLLVFVGILTFGVPPILYLSGDDRAAYDLVANAEYFSTPHVGIGGDTPDVVHAFRRLSRHQRSAAFRHMLLSGSPAGRLYALTALRRLNPAVFWPAAQILRFWPGQVQTLSGCVGETVPTKVVVAAHEEPIIRLSSGETLNEWWRHRPATDEQWQCDIARGCYTSMFLDEAEPVQPAG
ncbi:MAG TPA: hypothetical protein VGQ76_26520 [Thermoanaerobaculia bacterium]|jgi:hypothetical protein|nr:hypothetical protein [Thermoanaerobaculia bacterium]